MTVSRTELKIVLSGDCPVEDAETLVSFLASDASVSIDVDGCGRVHSAVVQVLLAARRQVVGVPANPFFDDWVLPQLLDASAETTFTEDEPPVRSRGVVGFDPPA